MLRSAPERARLIFLDYLQRADHMRDHPEWYKALTNNCTTNIAGHVAHARRIHYSWDWRILLNGNADEITYQRGRLGRRSRLPRTKRARAHQPCRLRSGDRSRFLTTNPGGKARFLVPPCSEKSVALCAGAGMSGSFRAAPEADVGDAGSISGRQIVVRHLRGQFHQP